ncbi:TenA family protein [Micromonospora sp. LOL_021]|uniref:TenA family protein n=1 Tax=Micromonospora sp. LOL_021 TaxID=3345417 RepID=UPI003A846FBE
MSFHEDLLQRAAPVLDKVIGHPFWTGLRDGSVPAECLTHFVVQDTEHLLPAYARALASTAAAAVEDGHTRLLARSVIGSLEARDRLRDAYQGLATDLSAPAPPEPNTSEPAPATRAYASFFLASASASVEAGVGALLPMVVFNQRVSQNLLDNHVPGSRYARWIEVYHPGPHYGYAVAGFLRMVDEVAAGTGAAGRQQLVGHFQTAVRYEWAFAEAARQRTAWPF